MHHKSFEFLKTIEYCIFIQVLINNMANGAVAHHPIISGGPCASCSKKFNQMKICVALNIYKLFLKLHYNTIIDS